MIKAFKKNWLIIINGEFYWMSETPQKSGFVGLSQNDRVYSEPILTNYKTAINETPGLDINKSAGSATTSVTGAMNDDNYVASVTPQLSESAKEY